jgi:hypothetical protein
MFVGGKEEEKRERGGKECGRCDARRRAPGGSCPCLGVRRGALPWVAQYREIRKARGVILGNYISGREGGREGREEESMFVGGKKEEKREEKRNAGRRAPGGSCLCPGVRRGALPWVAQYRETRKARGAIFIII